MTIGSRLRFLRERRGFNLAKTAHLLDLTESDLPALEADQEKPDRGQLNDLATFYGCSIGYILGRELLPDDQLLDYLRKQGAEFEQREREELLNMIDYLVWRARLRRRLPPGEAIDALEKQAPKGMRSLVGGMRDLVRDPRKLSR